MNAGDRVRVTVAADQPASCFEGRYATVHAVDHEGSVTVLIDAYPVPVPFAAIDLEPRALSVARIESDAPNWRVDRRRSR